MLSSVVGEAAAARARGEMNWMKEGKRGRKEREGKEKRQRQR